MEFEAGRERKRERERERERKRGGGGREGGMDGEKRFIIQLKLTKNYEMRKILVRI